MWRDEAEGPEFIELIVDDPHPLSDRDLLDRGCPVDGGRSPLAVWHEYESRGREPGSCLAIEGNRGRVLPSSGWSVGAAGNRGRVLRSSGGARGRGSRRRPGRAQPGRRGRPRHREGMWSRNRGIGVVPCDRVAGRRLWVVGLGGVFESAEALLTRNRGRVFATWSSGGRRPGIGSCLAIEWLVTAFARQRRVAGSFGLPCPRPRPHGAAGACTRDDRGASGRPRSEWAAPEVRGIGR
jgi:hypothetical protein